MKQWRELSPGMRVAVIGVLAFAAYLAGLLLIFRENILSALIKALFYVLILAGGLYFTRKRSRKAKARLDQHGQSLMFLRYPDSLPGSLSGYWQMGVATPAQGRIDFQPAVYEDLVPSGRSRALTGLRGTDTPSRASTRLDQKQSVPSGFRVITMDSDGGIIEIAASPDTIRKLEDAVAADAA